MSERFPGQESVSENVTIQDGGRTESNCTGSRKCRAAESVTLVADEASFIFENANTPGAKVLLMDL